VIRVDRDELPVDAHAFWLLAPGRAEIRPVTLPEPRADEVLVRTLRSGVSRGTETLVFRGGVPPGERAAMRAPFQEGDFPGPVKYGYLNVGIVEQGAAASSSACIRTRPPTWRPPRR
jgi:NADPH:quinone reductase-like Zn-dependent oxidoreductase